MAESSVSIAWAWEVHHAACRRLNWLFEESQWKWQWPTPRKKVRIVCASGANDSVNDPEAWLARADRQRSRFWRGLRLGSLAPVLIGTTLLIQSGGPRCGVTSRGMSVSLCLSFHKYCLAPAGRRSYSEKHPCSLFRRKSAVDLKASVCSLHTSHTSEWFLLWGERWLGSIIVNGVFQFKGRLIDLSRSTSAHRRQWSAFTATASFFVFKKKKVESYYNQCLPLGFHCLPYLVCFFFVAGFLLLKFFFFF